MKKGFTLVEILISLFILGLGIIFLFNLFPLGLQSLIYAHKLNQVSFLAQKKLEAIKSQPTVEAGQSSGKEGDLNWQISAQPLQLAEGPQVTCIQLDIDFDFKGAPQRQRFVTYITSE
jgi:prepilin-type N-terminal cleavage/methylation domain-containing protein